MSPLEAEKLLGLDQNFTVEEVKNAYTARLNDLDFQIQQGDEITREAAEEKKQRVHLALKTLIELPQPDPPKSGPDAPPVTPVPEKQPPFFPWMIAVTVLAMAGAIVWQQSNGGKEDPRPMENCVLTDTCVLPGPPPTLEKSLPSMPPKRPPVKHSLQCRTKDGQSLTNEVKLSVGILTGFRCQVTPRAAGAMLFFVQEGYPSDEYTMTGDGEHFQTDQNLWIGKWRVVLRAGGKSVAEVDFSLEN